MHITYKNGVNRFHGLSYSAIAYCVASAFGQSDGRCELSVPALFDNKTGGPILIVTPDRRIGEQLIQDLEFFLEGCDPNEQAAVVPFFPWEVLPFDGLSPARGISSVRLNALHRLQSGSRTIVVVPAEALMQRMITPCQFFAMTVSIALGNSISRADFVEKLERAGYLSCTLVEEPGDMAVRGAVVDVFPSGADYPLRVEFFRNEIDAIRCFETGTQRSVSELQEALIIPAREVAVFDQDSQSEDERSPSEIAVIRLRERASDLNIPLGDIASLETAVRSNMDWPGIEHLYPLLADKTVPFWEYVLPDTPVLIMDAGNVADAAERMSALVVEREAKAYKERRLYPKPSNSFVSRQELMNWLSDSCCGFFEPLSFVSSTGTDDLSVQTAKVEVGRWRSHADLKALLTGARATEKPFHPLAEQIRSWQADGISVGVVVSHAQRNHRVIELLSNYDIDCHEYKGSFFEWQAEIVRVKSLSRTVWVLNGTVSEGFVHIDLNTAFLCESELFPELAPRRKAKPVKNVRRFLGSLSQLGEGNYVVHVEHGIGLYQGLREVSIDGKTSDFLFLEYANGAKLFLPVENIGKVQKHVGVEGQNPVLNKLGSKVWEKTTAKVRKNVAELAGKLVNLYAERRHVQGYSFGDVDTLDVEFSDTFAFETTHDQQNAIEDVLSDMASTKPMDRLVCGDVGYGKTEVALRAAFKAVNAGKQAAILVPTTVLAEQHYATFCERMIGFAVEVSCVSRFFSDKENKETLGKLASGSVDIIIGTHRLLQKDVVFKNLGLLIIDEEHRFGVANKEKLKDFRKNIDVLALTATPIPRTLHMSLLGIRDLSVIETPPCDRQVIKTYLAAYDSSVAREAILREINRDGQVFFVHNRVQNIGIIADEVADLVPEATIAFAHGQMKEKELSNVMHRFMRRDIDVLVCTTIIESGLDITNANTIIIRGAENFGLAALYQLRGRVGRSSRRAYAYMFISNRRSLGSEAKRRLEVLQSLDDLGVGFRLALQDMEIRGAGNLLGRDQSGQVNAVGFDLYSQILKEAVLALRRKTEGRESAVVVSMPEVDPEMQIGFPAHIPPNYIPDVAERLLLYQRLVTLDNDAAGYEALEEIEDRFGRLPQEVNILLELMMFRALLRRAGIASARYRNGWLTWVFHPDVALDGEQIVKTVRNSDGNIKLNPNMSMALCISENTVESPGNLSDALRSCLSSIGANISERVPVSE